MRPAENRKMRQKDARTKREEKKDSTTRRTFRWPNPHRAVMVHFVSLVLLAPLSPLLVVLGGVEAPVSPPVGAHGWNGEEETRERERERERER